MALTTAVAQSDAPLSLADCYRIAEQNQPDLATAEAQVRAAEARLKERRSTYFTHLDFGASHNQETYNYAPPPGTDPRQFALNYRGEKLATSPYYYTGLNLNQNIYDFGRTRSSVERGTAELAQAQQSQKRVRQQVLLNVRTAYFGVLAAQSLVQVREKTVQDQSRHLEQIQAFFQVGRVPKIDVTRQEVQLANAQLDLVQARSDLTVAQAALATSMGLPVQNTFKLVDVLANAPELETVDSYLAEAQKSRPDLQAVREQVNAAQADVVNAQSNYRPKLSFSAFTNLQNLKFPLIWNLGFGEGLLQNLLSGGFNRGFLNEMEFAKTAAEYNLKSVSEQVAQDVYSSYANAQVSKEQIGLTMKADAEAQENLAFAEGRYSAGVGNIIELTDAELLAASSSAGVVTARYNYQVAVGRLQVAAGKEPSD